MITDLQVLTLCLLFALAGYGLARMRGKRTQVQREYRDGMIVETTTEDD